MREPDKRGRVAQAWQSRVPDPLPLESAAHVTSWIVRGPFHPAWHFWMVSAVDLAEREGTEPPHKRYPEAEYEVMILSLDPDAGDPDPDTTGGLRFLTPPDLVFQTHGVTREQVAEVVAGMVELMVRGALSPDSDFRSAWEQRLTAVFEQLRR